MKEKHYDKILKDEINPKKLYTFANVKLIGNFGINRMTNHRYILLFKKKKLILEGLKMLYFRLTPIHFNEVRNLKQHTHLLIGIICYSS